MPMKNRSSLCSAAFSGALCLTMLAGSASADIKSQGTMMSTGATPDPVSGEMSQLISGLGVGREQTLQGPRGFLEGPAFYPVIGADPPNNQTVNLASLPTGAIPTASADPVP